MTRNKILTAARELFEEKGFEPATVREIAMKAGVNVALINYHFDSKENLFATLVEETSQYTYMLLADIVKSKVSPAEKISQAVDLFVEKIFSNKRYYQMVHRELSTTQRPELNDAIAKPLKRNRDELWKIIDEGVQKKVFRKDVDIELTISGIFGLMYQATHTGLKACKLINKQSDDDDKFKERVKNHLQEMLKNHLKK